MKTLLKLFSIALVFSFLYGQTEKNLKKEIEKIKGEIKSIIVKTDKESHEFKGKQAEELFEKMKGDCDFITIGESACVISGNKGGEFDVFTCLSDSTKNIHKTFLSGKGKNKKVKIFSWNNLQSDSVLTELLEKKGKGKSKNIEKFFSIKAKDNWVIKSKETMCDDSIMVTLDSLSCDAEMIDDSITVKIIKNKNGSKDVKVLTGKEAREYLDKDGFISKEDEERIIISGDDNECKVIIYDNGDDSKKLKEIIIDSKNLKKIKLNDKKIKKLIEELEKEEKSEK